MKRNANAMIALFAMLTAGACKNMGLYDAGPADDARQSPPSELVSAVLRTAPEVGGGELVVDGRLWIASGPPVALDPQDVRPIGSANGRTVHARTWDRPPYDELFTPGDDERRWLTYHAVIGADVPAGSTQASPGETTGAPERPEGSAAPAEDV